MSRRERQQCITDFDQDMCVDNVQTDFFNRLFWHDMTKMKELICMHDKRAMFVSSNRGVIQYVNGKWCELCEYDKQEIVGKSFNVLQGTNTNNQKTKTFVDTLDNTGKSNMTIINYSKSGKELNLYVEAKKLSHDTCYGFIEQVDN